MGPILTVKDTGNKPRFRQHGQLNDLTERTNQNEWERQHQGPLNNPIEVSLPKTQQARH